MLNIIKDFADIIDGYRVENLDIEGKNIRLKMGIIFIDQSKLYIRDYVTEGERRKYSFHWQDKDNRLIIRWDNARHWPSVSTFPHHKHIGDKKAVSASNETGLKDVLGTIRDAILKVNRA